MTDFRQANVGDLNQGDVAQNIINITTSLEQVTQMLRDDVARLSARVDVLEVVERQHTTERAALTRLITQLATESHTVKDIQELLARQIDAEADDRQQRRQHLDMMLRALIALSVLNVALAIIRVLRGSGRPA